MPSANIMNIDNIEQIEQNPLKFIQVLIVGAGFSIGAYKNSKGLGWSKLVKKVDQILNPDENKEIINTNAKAMELSWEHSKEEVGSSITAFQRAIKCVIEAQYNTDDLIEDIQESLVEFLNKTICKIIIDLNYDKTIDTILESKNISYQLFVGSELNWESIYYEKEIILWKVHGTVKEPETIILSPMEYQRNYEINNIGNILQKLGNTIHRIWTLGVGLEVDEIWKYLFNNGDKCPDIFSLWVTEKDDNYLVHHFVSS